MKNAMVLFQMKNYDHTKLKKELKYKRKEPYRSKVKYFVESDVVEYSND